MIGNNTGNTKHILLLFLPKPTLYFSPWQIICNRVKSGLEENENVLILANLKPSSLRQHSTYHPDSWFWFSHKRSYISPITTLIPSGSPKENPPIAILKLKCCSKRNSQLPLLVSTCFDGKLLFIHNMLQMWFRQQNYKFHVKQITWSTFSPLVSFSV